MINQRKRIPIPSSFPFIHPQPFTLTFVLRTEAVRPAAEGPTHVRVRARGREIEIERGY